MNSELQKRLKALSDDLEGPLGPRPLDQVLRRHLDLFEELRGAGAQWSQIAHAIAAAGVRRADGGMVSADHLRGTVSRQFKARFRRSPPGPEAVTEPPAKRPSRLKHSGEKRHVALQGPQGQGTAPSPTTTTGARFSTAVPSPKDRETKKEATPEMPKRSQPGPSAIQAKLSRVAKLRGS